MIYVGCWIGWKGWSFLSSEKGTHLVARTLLGTPGREKYLLLVAFEDLRDLVYVAASLF